MTAQTKNRTLNASTQHGSSNSLKTLLVAMFWGVFILGCIVYLGAFPARYQTLLTLTNNPALSGFQVLSEYLLIACNFTTALLLLFRGRQEISVLLVAMGLMLLSNTIVNVYYAVEFSAWLTLPAFVLFVLNMGVNYASFSVFPTGHIYPRWVMRLLPVVMLWEAFRFIVFFLNPDYVHLRVPSLIVNFLLLLIPAYGQWQRYRYYNLEQRQQSKGLLLAMVAFISVNLIVVFLRVIFQNTGNPELINFGEFFYSFWAVTLGLALLVTLWQSITRQNLWSIDLTLNRSLVASGVTIGLMLIFGVVFIIIQALSQALLDTSSSQIALAVAAVFAAVSFQPVRKQVRHFVDRRLFGLRFDLNQLQAKQLKPHIEQHGALTGRILGEYEVLGVIGVGGMGEVYQAYSQKNNQQVAIKTLKENAVSSLNARERFQREGTLNLNHPNIIKTFGYSKTEDGIEYIALEYLQDRTLKDLLKDRGQLSLDEARELIYTLAQALDSTHQQRIIHRDLKPANIGLRKKDQQETFEAVLMDFGVAKVQDEVFTLTGNDIIGTISYMSPEQIMSAKTITHHSDIYAMAIVVYEILVGQPPFVGAVANVLFFHLKQPAPNPQEKVPDLPAHTALAIMRAMSKDPHDRFNSAGDFAKALF
jgi:hypothetical protein